MRRRPLPTAEEAIAILRARRTRPQIRPPPLAGKSLAPLIKKLDEQFGQGTNALTSRWKEIVGDALARRTEPVKLVKGRGGEGGALEIRVDGPAATVVQHQAPIILQRVGLVLGQGVVTRLRIIQGPVKPPSGASAAPKTRRRKGPLDAAAEKRLADGFAGAPDGPMRTALTRLGREILRRHGDATED